jgi:hypothetical protein
LRSTSRSSVFDIDPPTSEDDPNDSNYPLDDYDDDFEDE